MSDKAHDFGSLVCIYAQLLPKIREAAKPLGYAIAIHGSMKRDFDLVAVPWIEEAASAEELVKMIAKEVDGFVIGGGPEPMERGKVTDGTKQPHGRLSFNICWGGKPFIDLSVMLKSLNLWQPIETAPKDGRHILGYNGICQECWYKLDVDAWGGNGWHWGFDRQPTHWMSLPKPPEQSK